MQPRELRELQNIWLKTIDLYNSDFYPDKVSIRIRWESSTVCVWFQTYRLIILDEYRY